MRIYLVEENIVRLIRTTLLFLPLLLLSCSKLCNDEELKMEKVDYGGAQLRIDGYYYGNIDTISSPQLANIYYFWRNGIHQTRGTHPLNEAKAGKIPTESEKQAKRAWGVFQVNGSNIEIEGWGPGKCGLTRYYEKGEILNDTTFLISYYEIEDGRETVSNDVNRFYYFRQTDKPDSTNNFIQ